MNILYTIDENFIPQLATGISSICENNQQEKEITFYVIEQNIPDKDKIKIINFCNLYKRSVYFYSVKKLLSEFSEIDTGGWREIILARLLMGRLLPNSVKRIIYLDGDTLNISSLQHLWNYNLGNKCLGAVVEPTIDPRRKAALGIPKSKGYINSGVLLVDLQKWRESKYEEKIITFCNKNKELLFASDQDAINVVLSDDICYLPPCYNFCNSFYIYPYSAIRKMTSAFDYLDERSYTSFIENPVIIHYLGEDRPWRVGSTHKYKNYYFNYLHKTPYRDEPLEEGWESYFRAWSLFNKLIKPFPMMRLYLINHMIPFVKRIRKIQRIKESKKD